MEDIKAGLKKTIKKRIMFNKEDDYYFISYNILLFLYISGFTSREKRLIDYRKAAYILPFISNARLLTILDYGITKSKSANVDINAFQNLYINTRLNMKLFTAIVLALENKGYLHLQKNEERSCIDIWVDSEKIPLKFINNELFTSERKNILHFNKIVQRVRILSLDTLLERTYRELGVMAWEV